MKKITKSLARFTLFSAAACAILFGHSPSLHSVGRFPVRFDSGRVCHSQTGSQPQSGKAPHRHPPQSGLTQPFHYEYHEYF